MLITNSIIHVIASPSLGMNKVHTFFGNFALLSIMWIINDTIKNSIHNILTTNNENF